MQRAYELGPEKSTPEHLWDSIQRKESTKGGQLQLMEEILHYLGMYKAF